VTFAPAACISWERNHRDEFERDQWFQPECRFLLEQQSRKSPAVMVLLNSDVDPFAHQKVQGIAEDANRAQASTSANAASRPRPVG